MNTIIRYLIRDNQTELLDTISLAAHLFHLKERLYIIEIKLFLTSNLVNNHFNITFVSF